MVIYQRASVPKGCTPGGVIYVLVRENLDCLTCVVGLWRSGKGDTLVSKVVPGDGLGGADFQSVGPYPISITEASVSSSV